MLGVVSLTLLVISPGMGQFGTTPRQLRTYSVCGGSGIATTFHTTVYIKSSLSHSHQERSSCSKSLKVVYSTWKQLTNRVNSNKRTHILCHHSQGQQEQFHE